MWEMLKNFVRAFVRTLWKRAGVIGVGALTAIILGVGIRAYLALGAQADFSSAATVIDVTITALGLLSVVLLVLQMRQTAAYNRTISYHQYFQQTPSQDKVMALLQCLDRLGMPVPTVFKPLTGGQAELLMQDKLTVTSTDSREPAHQVLRNYLNAFEELCAAINVGLLSEKYVREIEGTRTINAYFGFEAAIKLIAAEQNIQAQARAATAPALASIHSKAYLELRKVARRWRLRREAEHRHRAKLDQALQNARNRVDRWFSDSDGDDGVSEE
jgi:hypothetical protein